MKTKTYEKPEFEIISVLTEQIFAASSRDSYDPLFEDPYDSLGDW